MNILCLGADKNNTFTVVSEKGVYTSLSYGDLTDYNVYTEFLEDIDRYLTENGIVPDVITRDMHPDYITSALAVKFRDRFHDAEILEVQHHFAHIAACLEENDISGDVIGVSFDGTGYGDDSLSWGGEFMVASRKRFERCGHLKYSSQPGGDIAAKEPWRMAVSCLFEVYGESLVRHELPVISKIGRKKVDGIIHMLKKQVNCPKTSSMGRLFDAVSSIADICHVSASEAEAAIKLEEAACGNSFSGSYKFTSMGEDIVCDEVIKEIVNDMLDGISKQDISGKFHNAVAEMIVTQSEKISKRTGLKKVVISGGCFQNRFLVELLRKKFKNSELDLVFHKKYPCSDRNISIGQAVIAEANIKDKVDRVLECSGKNN